LPWAGWPTSLALVAACSGDSSAFAPPPRANDPVVFANETSTFAAALAVDLGDLERQLERAVPRQLWAIDENDAECVSPTKVDLAVVSIKTPKIKCDIDGAVTRGRVRVTGRGQDLVVTMPVSATVRASDVAGLLKGETATAAADLRLAVKLDIARDWRLTGKPQIAYTWSRQPGIDFLGQRITFTRQADRELGGVRRDIERALAAEFARVPLRDAAERGWRAGHTVLELNRENPAVWARITPEKVRYGGYRIEGRRLVAKLGIDAKIEAKVGKQPAAPQPSPLPPLEALAATPGSARLHLPIIADHHVLEPVIAKALAKRAKRPFALGEVGTVSASFGKVTVYGTERNRIAVGVSFDATSDLALVPKAKGTIWLTARPVNAANSREVHFTDLEITGDTSLKSEALLFALANSPDFQVVITDALQQNFENDFAKLRGKIDRAIAQRQDGPLSYRVKIVRLETGAITAHGEGLYLPVTIEARIDADTLRIK
jgi:hypothetical protein